MELTQYIRDSYYELMNKISWLKMSDLQKTTITVTLASLVFALLVFGIDNGVKSLIDSYFKIFFEQK